MRRLVDLIYRDNTNVSYGGKKVHAKEAFKKSSEELASERTTAMKFDIVKSASSTSHTNCKCNSLYVLSNGAQ